MIKDRSISYRIFSIFNIILMIIASIIFIFPYLNTLAKAFNDPINSQLGGITFYPRVPTLYNFQVLLARPEIPWAAYITLARVISGTLLHVTVVFCAGYAMSKKGYRGRNAFISFMLIPMYISGGLIPYYLLLSNLKIINTFWVYILPGAFSFFNAVVVRIYINTNIPSSLEEAAKIDGGNDFYILLRVVLPLSAPILATICLFSAVGHWNDWTTTLYFVTNSRLHTLQYKLMQVLRESESMQAMIREAIKTGRGQIIMPKATPESIQSALVVATTLPIIMVYPFLQKYFIKGIVIGALKD